MGGKGTFVSMVSRLGTIMGDVHLRGQCRQQDGLNKMGLLNAFAAVRARVYGMRNCGEWRRWASHRPGVNGDRAPHVPFYKEVVYGKEPC